MTESAFASIADSAALFAEREAEPMAHVDVLGGGRGALVETAGNADCHVILRGGTGGPNHDADSVAAATGQLAAAGLPSRVMIDCSHANSGKDHVRQAEVAHEIADRIAAGERGISGLMLESFLVGGAQSLGGELVYGQSVTDKCMDFATTADALAHLHQAMQ